jgi:hypothetical protein
MMRPTYEARLDLRFRLPRRVSVGRSGLVEMDMALFLAAVSGLTQVWIQAWRHSLELLLIHSNWVEPNREPPIAVAHLQP